MMIILDESLKYVFKVLVNTHILFVLFAGLVYAYERKNDLSILATVPEPPKNRSEARARAFAPSIVYFLFNLSVWFYYTHVIDSAPPSHTFMEWFIFMIPLTVLFAKFYIWHVTRSLADKSKEDR